MAEAAPDALAALRASLDQNRPQSTLRAVPMRTPGPGDPGYADYIPPPEPLFVADSPPPAPLPPPVTPTGAPLSSPPGAARVVLSWGRQGGEIVVALERAPDWNIADTEVWVLDEVAVAQAAPVFRALATIKDLTAGGYARPTPRGYEGGPDADPPIQREGASRAGHRPAAGRPGRRATAPDAEAD